MTTIFEVVVSSNLMDLSELMDSSYGTLKRRSSEGDGPFFVKRRGDGLMWTVKWVRVVRASRRGGKRVKRGSAGDW